MKKIYILTLGLVLSNYVKSQNYVPLLIDSLHSWGWTIDFHGDTIVGGYGQGYTYDANENLIQVRFGSGRSNYIYEMDAPYSLIQRIDEQIDSNNSWNLTYRSTFTYENGRKTSELSEQFEDNSWVNSGLRTYFYNNLEQNILYLLQHWNDGVWVDFYKEKKIFDTNGNKIELAKYYVDSNGEFSDSTRILFDYNNANYLIQETNVNTSGNYTAREIYVYGDDNLLDTILRCRFNFPDYEICENRYMLTYQYLEPDTIIVNNYAWYSNEWHYLERELIYSSQEIYSDQPDSVIIHSYLEDSQVYVPKSRRYLQYEELDNDIVYLKNERHDYFPETNEWRLTRLYEEWYHLKTIVNVDNKPQHEGFVSIYPNPCNAGQNLNLDNHLTNKDNLEIFIFDMQGKLVFREIIESETPFSAPKSQGVYTILVLKKGKLIGLTKQVIIE